MHFTALASSWSKNSIQNGPQQFGPLDLTHGFTYVLSGFLVVFSFILRPLEAVTSISTYPPSLRLVKLWPFVTEDWEWCSNCFLLKSDTFKGIAMFGKHGSNHCCNDFTMVTFIVSLSLATCFHQNNWWLFSKRLSQHNLIPVLMSLHE